MKTFPDGFRILAISASVSRECERTGGWKIPDSTVSKEDAS